VVSEEAKVASEEAKVASEEAKAASEAEVDIEEVKVHPVDLMAPEEKAQRIAWAAPLLESTVDAAEVYQLVVTTSTRNEKDPCISSEH